MNSRSSDNYCHNTDPTRIFRFSGWSPSVPLIYHPKYTVPIGDWPYVLSKGPWDYLHSLDEHDQPYYPYPKQIPTQAEGQYV